MELLVLVTGHKVETRLTQLWAHHTQLWARHEGRVVVGVVVDMLLDEKWGFDESVPVFAHTLESL